MTQQDPQTFSPHRFPLPVWARGAEEGIQQPSGSYLYKCNTYNWPFSLTPITVQRQHTWPNTPCWHSSARVVELIVTAASSDNGIMYNCLWAVGYAVSWEELCHMEHNLSHAFRTLPKPYSCSHSVNGSSSVMEKE